MRRLERRAAEAEEAASQQEAAGQAASERMKLAEISCQYAQGAPHCADKRILDNCDDS